MEYYTHTILLSTRIVKHVTAHMENICSKVHGMETKDIRNLYILKAFALQQVKVHNIETHLYRRL